MQVEGNCWNARGTCSHMRVHSTKGEGVGRGIHISLETQETKPIL